MSRDLVITQSHVVHRNIVKVFGLVSIHQQPRLSSHDTTSTQSHDAGAHDTKSMPDVTIAPVGATWATFFLKFLPK
jgi:hypothetical protein